MPSVSATFVVYGQYEEIHFMYWNLFQNVSFLHTRKKFPKKENNPITKSLPGVQSKKVHRTDKLSWKCYKSVISIQMISSDFK